MAELLSEFRKLIFGLDPAEALEAGGKEIGEIANKGLDIVDKTTGNIITGLDNFRSDGLYTIRDTKHEGLTMLDSALDNLTITINKQGTNFFNTVQTGTVLSFMGFLYFLVMYGDKVFENGVKIGGLSFL